MGYLIVGTIAFLLFIAYDINDILWNKQWLHHNFFLGCVLLLISTAGIINTSFKQMPSFGIKFYVFGGISLFFFVLLVYTLFFALPFNDTYVKLNSTLKVYQDGVYALCRHPGVLWFAGFYIFLWLSLNNSLAFMGAILFSTLNIVYATFQDKWSFVKKFQNYNSYKNTTPFLIPNVRSINKFINTLHREGRANNEI